MKDISRRKVDNAGTTLIETLAAFTVLAAILTILFHIVNFSGTLRTQAVDAAHLDQMFQREVCKNDGSIDTSFVEITYYSREGGEAENELACGFWMVLDTEKTVLNKNYLGVSYDENGIKDNPPLFRMDNLGITVYTCRDNLIEEEKLPRPVMVSYHFNAPAP